MLLQFSVENFRSIKDRAVLSLEGSADKENPNNFVMYGKNKYLKGAAIFGANGAGKSNIFKALTAAILTIRRSNDRQIEEPLFLIAPFLFDRKCIKQPSSFEFVFITGGIKYVYGFSSTNPLNHLLYLSVLKRINTDLLQR